MVVDGGSPLGSGEDVAPSAASRAMICFSRVTETAGLARALWREPIRRRPTFCCRLPSMFPRNSPKQMARPMKVFKADYVSQVASITRVLTFEAMRCTHLRGGNANRLPSSGNRLYQLRPRMEVRPSTSKCEARKGFADQRAGLVPERVQAWVLPSSQSGTKGWS